MSPASDPTLSKVTDKGKTPSSGTVRWVGLKPASPLKAAGIRTEPPVSEPNAASAMPVAIDRAPPEVEPPGIRVGSWLLPGVP